MLKACAEYMEKLENTIKLSSTTLAVNALLPLIKHAALSQNVPN